MHPIRTRAHLRRLMFITDTDASGGGSTDTSGADVDESTDDTDTGPGDSTDQEADTVNWQEKFEAQQKINRDLERKVKGEAGTLQAKLDALQAKLDGTEAEHAETLKSRQTEEAALAKANERIRKAEVRAAAAGKLSDPADALKFLDLEQFEVGSDGEVDTSAINEALEGLVKSKPYLAAQGGSGVTFESPGAHRKERAGQVTQAELDRMTPDQINAARAEGRLNDLLGIKP
ncbi:hypothetical protein [Oerskovia sp. Root22]|uniref:hypothetical protein n=1 Tax=Oerskovia sp. Root22 TaxID=1736494 RepID=UPI0006F8CFF4|nr:hypothetical protein [Oerskovia sp. Root22]KRC37517.1 hypothetical protein ASE15_05230 [Oerskovia sp. Root22]